MSVPIITLDMLRQHDACSDQQELFVATFGQSAKLTRRNWARAIKVGLSVSWMERLLSDAALAEYVKVRDAALAEYVKARDAALYDALVADLAEVTA